ncbi:hypothetical protein [Amycolatopsis sp.]|uniref:hypothetical protein n=1 Tax=Amycolatopsis sp. TaxID=37632 RepID=UPI002CC8B1AE|nr:hypothetical protein [Amycolatopsis sp.]HVV11502.1 hypothetical protein [Amycolatopsis sp.]
MKFRKQKPVPSTPLPRPAAPVIAPKFTKIAAIDDSIRELYSKLSAEKVRSYAANLAPVFTKAGNEPVGAVQELATTMVRHLGMSGVRLIVSFAALGSDGAHGHAGEVEIGSGPDYFVRMSDSYRRDLTDAAGVLSHEAMHVFLARANVAFPERDRNEILTDTAAVYLGLGWTMLNAHRQTTRYEGGRRFLATQTLGYVSPAELGYILAKRALAFDENIEAYLGGNNLALTAYRAGYSRALDDYRRAPLAACSAAVARQYDADKKFAVERTRATGISGLVREFDGGYKFEGYQPMHVVFRCPACHTRLRAPIDRKVTVRCRVCRSTLSCRT